MWPHPDSSKAVPKARENSISPLNAELNPICHLLALLGSHHILHISRIRVKMGEKKGRNSENYDRTAYARKRVQRCYLTFWAGGSYSAMKSTGLTSHPVTCNKVGIWGVMLCCVMCYVTSGDRVLLPSLQQLASCIQCNI